MPDVRLGSPLRVTSRPRSAEGGGERRALIPRWQEVARLGSSGGRPNISLNPTRLSEPFTIFAGFFVACVIVGGRVNSGVRRLLLG